MSEKSQTNARLVREYLAALQGGEVGEALARFFTPDAIQVELPNRLNPKGQESDLPSLLARSIQGQLLLKSQQFDVLNVIVEENSVAVETHWKGVLAVDIGTLAAGAEMRAHFAMFFACHDGRIRRQRNYDCFEHW